MQFQHVDFLRTSMFACAAQIFRLLLGAVEALENRGGFSKTVQAGCIL